MRRYTGILPYTADNSGRLGRTIHADMAVSFPPGLFLVRVEDSQARPIHVFANRRFNYQARGSPQDWLARAKWRIEWFDRFAGPAYLQCPRIAGVSRELLATMIRSWGPAFAVIEFRLGDAL